MKKQFKILLKNENIPECHYSNPYLYEFLNEALSNSCHLLLFIPLKISQMLTGIKGNFNEMPL